MNKNESKYFNTACLMDEALLQLLAKKDYEYITVKEICSRAGVNRSTFYLHYENMDDLLKESVSYMERTFYEKFEKAGTDKIDVRKMTKDEAVLIKPEYLRPYLEFVKENTEVYKLAVTKGELFGSAAAFKRMYGNIFEPVLKKFDVKEEDRPYVFAYYMNGVLAIVTTWIDSGCKRSVDDIIRFITEHVPVHDNGNTYKSKTSEADENERK
ncbi:MAG: TetR/AcrR family transcriptional regulator [Clostridia bacterium]|nr:TetR/AcrR family transcriptional regulator [Clostridia bacterium]